MAQLKKLFVAISTILIMGSPAMAAAFTIDLNRLADNEDEFDFFGDPAINDRGAILFTSGNAVTVIENGQFRTIVEGEPGIDSYDFASFNNNGDVLIRAFSQIGTVNSLLFSSGGQLNTLITDRQGFSSFDGRPSINDAGQIAFRAQDSSVGNPFGEQVIVRGTGGVFDIIESPGGPFELVVGPTKITNDGDVIYFGRIGSNNVALVREDANGEQTIIAETGVDIPGIGRLRSFRQDIAVNENGDIVFSAAGFSQTPDAIYLFRDGVLTKVREESGLFTSIAGPSINNLGDISFFNANSDGTSSLQFMSFDGQIGTILSSGDTLDGLVVRFITASANAINDDRNVVFSVQFEDGSSALYSASITAVPLPAASLIFIAGVFFLRKTTGHSVSRS